MSQVEITPAPEFQPVIFSDPKWDREHGAFVRLLPSLLETHRGRFVAIHGERVVGSGDDQIEIALAAYAQFGYVPIFVGQVSDVPQPVARVASPRVRGTNGA